MNERIQALRGVSVLLVVIQHGLIGEWLVPTGYFNPAWFGVYLFFIISGCVITESLICDDAHFGRFIVRRVFRLLPAMLAFIALAYALNWLLAKEVGYPLGPITEKRFWIYAAASVTGMVAPFMYMNLFPPVPFMFAHIWSISVEDVFYLIFGLLAAKALIRTSPTTTIRVILGLVLSVMLLRVVGWKWRAPWEALSEAAGRGEIFAWIGQVLLLPLTLPIFGGMDFILAGIVVNLVARGRVSAAPLPNRSTDILAAALILVALVALASTGHPLTSAQGMLAPVGLPIALLCASLAVFLCWRNTTRLTSWIGRSLKHLGDLSYSLYLFHMPIAALASSLLYRIDIGMQHGRPLQFAILFFIIYAVISYLLALASYRWIERPMMAKGREVAARIGQPAVRVSGQ